MFSHFLEGPKSWKEKDSRKIRLKTDPIFALFIIKILNDESPVEMVGIPFSSTIHEANEDSASVTTLTS